MRRFRKSSSSSLEYFKGQHRYEHWYLENQVYFITVPGTVARLYTGYSSATVGFWKSHFPRSEFNIYRGPRSAAKFRAKKNNIRLEVRLPPSEETTKKLEASGVDLIDHDNRWGRYRIRISPPELEERKRFLAELLKQAYDLNKS